MKILEDGFIDVDLVPDRGLALFCFGETYEKVVTQIQEPEQWEEWMGGNLNDSILIQGVILGFDDCDSADPLPHSKFCSVDVNGRPSAKFLGIPFDEIGPEKFSKLCEGYGIRVVPQRAPNGILYYENDDKGNSKISAEFTEGVLRSVYLGIEHT